MQHQRLEELRIHECVVVHRHDARDAPVGEVDLVGIDNRLRGTATRIYVDADRESTSIDQPADGLQNPLASSVVSVAVYLGYVGRHLHTLALRYSARGAENY